jgi:glycosyltransferase involved in cell wall biosynthesis
MRILMVVPKYPFPIAGGLERQAHELATTLLRRGHAIDALSTAFDPEQSTIDVVDGVRVHRVPWHSSVLVRFVRSPLALARVLWRLRAQIDVVHVHNISWFGAFVTLVANAMGLPVITKLPGSGESGIPGMLGRKLGPLRVTLLKASPAIVAMTAESMSELASIEYPRERVLKVTNGIRLVPVKQRSVRPAAVNVVFVGRLLPQKGLTDLLHAWCVVKSRVRERATLRVFGDGPQLRELRILVESLKLGDVVELCGYCRDVPAELAKADLFVLPSYGEGNSNAVLEAMRAALPIVATRVGGVAYQVGDEGAQCLFEVGDWRALADRLLELIDDEPARHRLGSAMRTRVECVFDIECIASTYLQAYELLLSGHGDELDRINANLFDAKGS